MTSAKNTESGSAQLNVGARPAEMTEPAKPDWVFYALRYQVRNSRQGEKISGKKWVWATSERLSEEDARKLYVGWDGKNIRNTQLIRIEEFVVEE